MKTILCAAAALSLAGLVASTGPAKADNIEPTFAINRGICAMLKDMTFDPSGLTINDCIATDNGIHEIFDGPAAVNNNYQATRYGCEKLLEFYVSKLNLTRFQLEVTVMPSGVSAVCIPSEGR